MPLKSPPPMGPSSTKPEAVNNTSTRQNTDTNTGENNSNNSTSPPASIEMSQEALAKAQQQFEECIKLIEPQEKQAYLECMEKAPFVVEQETPALRFLRYKQFDAWAAAKQLTVYWECRKCIFGSQRFYLPLTFDGEGAFDKIDLQVYNTGWIVVFNDDAEGRSVFGYDRSRLEKDFDDLEEIKWSRLKCVFATMHFASENELAQTVGCRTLGIFTSAYREIGADRELGQLCVKYIIPAIPVRPSHDLIFRPPRDGRRSFLDNAVPPMVNFIVSAVRRRDADTSTCVLAGLGKNDLLNELLKRGYTVNGIPKDLGGKWLYHEHFTKWMRERMVRDKARLAVSASDNNEQALLTAAEIYQEESARKKRRELDALYARRKRAKTRIEIEVLNEEVDRLKKQRNNFKNSISFRESLLKRATEITDQIEGGHDIQDVQPTIGRVLPKAQAGSMSQEQTTKVIKASRSGSGSHRVNADNSNQLSTDRRHLGTNQDVSLRTGNSAHAPVPNFEEPTRTEDTPSGIVSSFLSNFMPQSLFHQNTTYSQPVNSLATDFPVATVTNSRAPLPGMYSSNTLSVPNYELYQQPTLSALEQAQSSLLAGSVSNTHPGDNATSYFHLLQAERDFTSRFNRPNNLSQYSNMNSLVGTSPQFLSTLGSHDALYANLRNEEYNRQQDQRNLLLQQIDQARAQEEQQLQILRNQHFNQILPQPHNALQPNTLPYTANSNVLGALDHMRSSLPIRNIEGSVGQYRELGGQLPPFQTPKEPSPRSGRET